MNYSCPNCGSLNVQDHATIIEHGISFTTIRHVYGYTYTTRHQSPLSQQLSAGKPRKGINWFTIVCLWMIMPPLVLLSFASCATLEAVNGNSINIQSFTLLAACVAAIIVVSIVMAVVSKVRTKRYNQEHNNWLNLMRRRYYCSGCGYTFQI